MATTPGNSVNETTTGISGFTGTSFTGSPATQHCVQIGGATSSTLANVTNGTTGQVLTAITGSAPTFQTASSSSGSAFRAIQSTDVNNVTGDGTVYTILYNSPVQTADNSYNSGTGRYTAPRTDYYIFTVSVWLKGVTAVNHTTINGIFNYNANAVSVFQYCDTSVVGVVDAGGNCLVSSSIILPMTAGDTLSTNIAVSGNSKVVGLQGGTNTPTQYGNYFTGAALKIL